VAVDEPLRVIGQTTPGQLSVGDTIKVGDAIYTVSGTATTEGTIVHEDQYGLPETTEAVPLNALSLTPLNGGTEINYLVPTDSAGDFPEITEITPTAPYTPVASFDLEDPDDNDIGSDEVVTLAGDEDDTAVFDLIRIDGFNPATNGTLSTDPTAATNGTLLAVSDKASVSLADPSKFATGDTVTIDGVDWTVTAIWDGGTGDITHDDPATGAQVTTADVPLIGFGLADGSGATRTYAVPADSAGDFPQITDPSWSSWSGRGAEMLVHGYVRARPSAQGDDRLVVGCYLYDVALQDELIREGWVVRPADWRR